MELQRRGGKPASAAVVGCGFATGSREEDEAILFHVSSHPLLLSPASGADQSCHRHKPFPVFLMRRISVHSQAHSAF